MKENSYEESNENNEENINIQELFFKYIIHWPWLVAAIVISLLGAWMYLKYTTPIYNISASVIIKDDKKGGAAGATAELESLGLGGMMSSSKNIDNEIEILRSKTLIKEVVNSLGLYTSYTSEDEFPSKILYKDSPILVNIPPQQVESLKGSVLIDMKLAINGSLNVTIKTKDNEINKVFTKLPAILPTKIGTFSFIQNQDSTLIDGNEKKERHIIATVTPSLRVAKSYLGKMTIEPTSKTSSVAVISLKNSSLQRGQDFINRLLATYNRNANDDKNEIARKTGDFIDSRISIINKELGSTEEELATFKRNAGLTDLSSDAQIALSGNAEYEKKQVENGTQIRLVRDLSQYINDPSNKYEVLPSNIGLKDQILSSQIDRYNEMIIERKRLIRNSTENNPTIVNLSTSIQAMKMTVIATIEATMKGLLITKADLDREANRFNKRITNAPGFERQLGTIARQQEIKAGLYLMLLQKREENAITLAATTNNAKIIDEAIADDIPVSPKRNMIYLIALVLGISVPIGIIYLINLTQIKIEGVGDVEKITKAPIIGSVTLTEEKDSQDGSIAVFENQNNLMSETFRDIRTNIQFMLEKDKKVILVTSTISGEGKSFISSNVAISLSLLGKKVVIVGLDIRKPGLNKVFHLSQKEKGITHYLASSDTDLMSLVQESASNSNLFILPTGTIPPNPTELLARDRLDKAIEILKENFDYVVLDTSPVGMVTDTQLVGRVADLSIYVCRADYTHKAEFALINELNNKLPNLCTIINGIDIKKKKYGYYGYAKYGKYYGYGKRYGYGYGSEHQKR
ncbi:MAG: GumC family protein [Bacteroides sp.]